MAETDNIARMAEHLSQDLFGEFLWRRAGPLNQNWNCENVDAHKVKTHPTDVVFFYDEPYSLSRTYLQTDLKSYARGSITSNSIRSAVKSLAKQVSCAEISAEWRGLYVHEGIPSHDVCGLLFVYNHDNEYDKDFSAILDEIKSIDIDIPKRSRIYIIGPDDIYWLNNVRSEIQRMRGRSANRLPDREHCSYLYPQLVRKANVRGELARAATMEMLNSPWIILRYRAADGGSHLVVFVRRAGELPDEYMYLLDYLRSHELLSESRSITIRVMAEGAGNAALLLDKAKSQYIDGVLGQNPDTPLAKTIDDISLVSMDQVVTSFSTIVLGMDS